MNRFFLILFFLSLVVQAGEVHSQSVTWEKLYARGTTYRGIQTNDGGYVSVGTTRISGNSKIFVLKTNVIGDSIWYKIYNTDNLQYGGYWIEQTNDNGFIICGDIENNNGDAYVLKIDYLGNIQWERNFDNGTLEQALRVFKTIDGGFIIGARSELNLWIIKTNNLGIISWQKEYICDGFIDLITDDMFGYFLMGYLEGNKLYRLDLKGDTLWTKSNVGNSIGASLRRLSDGSFIVGGSTHFNECVVTKTDSIGNVQWEFQYPGIGREIIYDLEILPNNRGYLISGSTDSLSNYDFKAFIRVIDTEGNVKFKKYYTPIFYPTDYAEFRSGIPTSDGGFYLAGSIAPIFPGIAYLVKTDSLGNFKTVRITNSEINLTEVFTLFQNYPNPFNPKTVISYELPVTSLAKLIVYDVLGNEVALLVNEKQNAGSYSVEFDGSRLSSGVYFYKLEADDFRQVKRMVMLK